MPPAAGLPALMYRVPQFRSLLRFRPMMRLVRPTSYLVAVLRRPWRILGLDGRLHSNPLITALPLAHISLAEFI